MMQTARFACIPSNWLTVFNPWVPQREFSQRFVDIIGVKDLILAFTTMVAPASKDQPPLTPYKIGYLPPAEVEPKNYQVDFQHPHSELQSTWLIHRRW